MNKLSKKNLLAWLGAACIVSCTKEQPENLPEVQLGKQLENPYSVENMKKAYQNLMEKKENGDTINSHITREDGPFLFHIEDQVGDSVIVKFADDKCLTYTDNLDNPNNKIFNIDDYDNFDTRLIEPGERYNLYYTFTEEDYNLAVDRE